MLRLLVLALTLANGIYFAWSHGLLRAYGFAPIAQSEPQRLEQQIRPDALRIVPSGEAKRLELEAQAELAPKECLMAGPFNDSQALVLRRAMETELAAGSWQIDTTVVPERWIVYMGKFPDAAALGKKRAELLTKNLLLETIHNPDLEPGLSLGGFVTKDAAAQALDRLSLRGVRTARVVLEHGQSTINQLKLPAISPELKQQLENIKPALAGTLLRPCN